MKTLFSLILLSTLSFFVSPLFAQKIEPLKYFASDIALFHYNDKDLHLHFSNSSTFTGPTNYSYSSYPSPQGVTSGDFDGDCRSDIAYYNGSTVYVYLKSVLPGIFVTPPIQFVVSQGYGNVLGITSGDYNGDGRDDIAVFKQRSYSNTTRNLIIVYIARGHSGMSSYVSFEFLQQFNENNNKHIEGITSGNFDGDADNYDDIAFYRANDTNGIKNLIKVAISHGTWFEFRANSFTYGGDNFYGITSGDYTGDGKDDVAIYRPRTGTIIKDVVCVFRSTEDNFALLQEFHNSNLSYDIKSITSGDFDNNGLEDISFVKYKSDTKYNYIYAYKSLYGNPPYFDYMTQFTNYDAGKQVFAIRGGRYDMIPSASAFEKVNGIFKSHGINYFPIGWYSDSDCTRVRDIASCSYVNTVMPYLHPNPDPDCVHYLDSAQVVSLLRIEPLNVIIEMSRQAIINNNHTPIIYRVNNCEGHNRLLGWNIYDEPYDPDPAVNLSPSYLQPFYTTIHQQDNFHPNFDHDIFLVEGYDGWLISQNNRYYTEACDIAMWDRYPLIPGLPNLPSEIRQVAESAHDLLITIRREQQPSPMIIKKPMPIIAVLQGYGEFDKDGNQNFPGPPDERRDPSVEEVRYMTYTSIAHGARGILFYTYNRASSIVEDRVEAIIQEIKTITPDGLDTLIMNKPYSHFVRSNRDDEDSDGDGRIDINYFLRKNDTNHYSLIVVNDCNSNKSVEFTLLPFTNISDVDTLRDNTVGLTNRANPTIISSNKFSDTFTRFDVHIYLITGSGYLAKSAFPYSENVDDKSTNFEIPLDYQLSQNYPNPFNLTTTIRYSIAKTGKISLTIFNLQGQEVKTLVNELKPMGSYSVGWDATTNDGNEATSGIYILQMKSGDFMKSQKISLIK